MAFVPSQQNNLLANSFLNNERFSRDIRLEEVQTGQILAEADQPIPEVCFPRTAVVSLVVPMENEKNVEVALVGHEGVIGLPVALDTQQHLRAIVQIPGEIYKLDPQVFRQAIEEDHQLNRLVGHFILVRLQQIAQTAACNQLHRVQQRICRWLLMCHDRVQADQFQLTHHFLSQMLGVRRATVSDAAAKLQVEGIIKYRRGHVTITDRTRLEAKTCNCYGIVKREIDRLLK